MLILRTLGELELLSEAKPVRISRIREMAVLVYLACNAQRTHRRAQLAGMFWPRSSERLGLHSLSQAMYRLAQRAPGLAFEADARLVRIDLATLEIDLLQFRKYLKEGEHERAAALYRGPFLDGFVLDEAPELEEWLE